ncbi:MAG TPA: hypothetical protein VEL06_06455 [Haliangiales bacterium]|nr:hypothetical protein [Haliangiales bacterium]
MALLGRAPKAGSVKLDGVHHGLSRGVGRCFGRRICGGFGYGRSSESNELFGSGEFLIFGAQTLEFHAEYLRSTGGQMSYLPAGSATY